MEWNTVVVGYDGSDHARAAVDAAAALVAEKGLVHVVTAYDMPSASSMARLWEQIPDEFRNTFDVLAEPEGLQQEALQRLSAAGVEGVGHLVEDDPAAAVLDTAERVAADLVVVGSQGRGRTTRFLRGSVSTRVAEAAHTSVMVVHTG